MTQHDQRMLDEQFDKSQRRMLRVGGRCRSKKSRLIKKRGMAYVHHDDRVRKLINRGWMPF